jgi:hypothetical protein
MLEDVDLALHSLVPTFGAFFVVVISIIIIIPIVVVPKLRLTVMR